MRLIVLRKKKQKEALISLCALARIIHKNNMELWMGNPRDYAFMIEVVADLAYIVGGIPGMNTVRQLGFEWKDGDAE